MRPRRGRTPPRIENKGLPSLASRRSAAALMVSPSIIPLKPFAGLRTEYSIEQLGRLYDQFFTPHKLSYMHRDVVGGDALKPVHSDTANGSSSRQPVLCRGLNSVTCWQSGKSSSRC